MGPHFLDSVDSNLIPSTPVYNLFPLTHIRHSPTFPIPVDGGHTPNSRRPMYSLTLRGFVFVALTVTHDTTTAVSSRPQV